MDGIHCRPVVSGVHMGAIHSLKITPKKKCDTLRHLHVASVEPPCLETTYLKHVCICKAFCALLKSALCT
jgi:hypothetical protein